MFVYVLDPIYALLSSVKSRVQITEVAGAP